MWVESVVIKISGVSCWTQLQELKGNGWEIRQYLRMMYDSSTESGLDSHLLHCFNLIQIKYILLFLLSIFKSLTT